MAWYTFNSHSLIHFDCLLNMSILPKCRELVESIGRCLTPVRDFQANAINVILCQVAAMQADNMCMP